MHTFRPSAPLWTVTPPQGINNQTGKVKAATSGNSDGSGNLLSRNAAPPPLRPLTSSPLPY